MSRAKVKPFRLFNDKGVRMGRTYSDQSKAIDALKRLDSAGYVERLYHGVVAAKNDIRGRVMVLDNTGMPRHLGNVETAPATNPNPSPFN